MQVLTCSITRPSGYLYLWSRHGLVGFFACLLGVLSLGCERYGRIDATETTEAETRSFKVLPVTLMEFSDQVSQRLTQDLSELPTIEDLPKPITVVMGDINNQTQTVSSNEFEMVRSRIRSNLLQSRYVRDRIRFVESQGRMAYLRERELGSATENEPRYDPDTTFVLNGDFFGIHRGDTHQYYMEFQLVSFASNEIVFSQRYDVKQIRQDD